MFNWLLTSPEVTNFTFALSEIAYRYYAHFVGAISGIAFKEAHAYINELHGDVDLQAHVKDAVKAARIGRAIPTPQSPRHLPGMPSSE